MPKVAVYLRQSLDRSGEGAAVDRQRESCRQLCAARGWTIVAEYVDNSVSATNGNRPEWTRLLRDVERGRFDVILAWALDRLTRSMRDTEALVTLCESTGVRVATVAGDIDLTTDAGRLVGRILSAVARGEVERKSERQRLANAQRAEQGRPPVGRRALGWRRDGMTLVLHEADQVRRGFEIVLTGGSLRGVARMWNDAGLRTSNGKPWQPYSVRGVLENPRYAGLRALKGEIIAAGAWPSIVDEETWRATVRVLTDPARRTTPSTARRYLLSGLATCGRCGAPVNTGGTRHHVRTYKCSATRHLSRAAQPLDDYINAVVVERLSRPDALDLLTVADHPDVAAMHAEADQLRRRILVLADDLGINERTLARRDRALRAKLAEVEGRLADAGRTDVLGPLVAAVDVAEVWAALDLDRRRAVIDLLMTVTLLPPGRGARLTYDPDDPAALERLGATLAIEWRA